MFIFFVLFCIFRFEFTFLMEMPAFLDQKSRKIYLEKNFYMFFFQKEQFIEGILNKKNNDLSTKFFVFLNSEKGKEEHGILNKFIKSCCEYDKKNGFVVFNKEMPLFLTLE
jgi:hypothetical protein